MGSVNDYQSGLSISPGYSRLNNRFFDEFRLGPPPRAKATVTQPKCKSGLTLINSWDTDSVDQIVIESCHSTWIIDLDNSRFRRLVKDSEHRTTPTSTEWQPCYGVEIDPLSESFVVLLNSEGTRLLRSWRHVEHCSQCGGEATSELSLRDLRSAVRS